MGGIIINDNGTLEEWLIVYKSVSIMNNVEKNTEKNIGRWILLIEATKIEHSWLLLKDYFFKIENNIIMIRCSNYNNKNILKLNHGVLMIYYDDSFNKKKIIKEGYLLLKLLDYIYEKKIYYRLNLLRDIDKYYLYVIDNYLYKKKCKECNCFLNSKKQSTIINGPVGNDYEKWFLLDKTDSNININNSFDTDNVKCTHNTNIYDKYINSTYDSDDDKNEHCVNIYNKNMNIPYNINDEKNEYCIRICNKNTEDELIK